MSGYYDITDRFAGIGVDYHPVLMKFESGFLGPNHIWGKLGPIAGKIMKIWTSPIALQILLINIRIDYEYHWALKAFSYDNL
jgi:hypothetical protein